MDKTIGMYHSFLESLVFSEEVDCYHQKGSTPINIHKQGERKLPTVQAYRPEGGLASRRRGDSSPDG